MVKILFLKSNLFYFESCVCVWGVDVYKRGDVHSVEKRKPNLLEFELQVL